MASGYTPYYGLCQWQPEDKFMRTEFNQDNAKVEGALRQLQSGKCEVVFGTYTGNGAATQTIHLGFTPKAVLLENVSGMRLTNAGILGGLILPGKPLASGSATGGTIVANGFTVYYTQYYSCTNQKNDVFYYIAFR